MLCESVLQSFRLYRWLDVWCRSRLPSAEKAAQDRFKTALRQRFTSAPGRKHPNQKHQEEEHDQSCGHIREDQVGSAGGQRYADEGSSKSRQDEQETATPAQPGPWSPGPQLWMTPPPAGYVAGGQESREWIILRWRWRLYVGRPIAWLRSSRKLAWRAHWWCARLHAAGDTEGSSRCQRLPAVGAESWLWLSVHEPPSSRSVSPERGFLCFEGQHSIQTFPCIAVWAERFPWDGQRAVVSPGLPDYTLTRGKGVMYAFFISRLMGLLR